MTLIEVNMEAIALSGNAELLGVGVYPRLECISAKVDKKDGAAHARVNCKFRDASTDPDEDKAVVFNGFSLNPEYLWSMKQFLSAAGSELADEAGGFDTDDLVGLIASGQIGTNNYTKDGAVIESVQVKKWIVPDEA